MTAGRPSTPLEKQRATARGDGRTPGGRKITPPTQPTTGTVALPDASGIAPSSVLPALPALPDGLGQRGEVEWYKIWETGQSWLHPQEDFRWVEMIARAYDDNDAFRKKVKSDGLVCKGYAGQDVAHPLIAEIRKNDALIMKCLSVLGFSPSDRARLGIAHVKLKTGLQNLQNEAAKNR